MDKKIKNKMSNLKCKPQYNSGWWLPFVDVHLVWHQAIHDQCLKVHSRTRCASKIEKKKMKKMSENEYHLDLGREDWYHLKASLGSKQTLALKDLIWLYLHSFSTEIV